MLLLLPITTYAANWKLVTSCYGQEYYLDISDIQQNDYTIELWVKTVNEDSFKYNNIKTLIVHYEVNLKNEVKYRGLSFITYDEDGKVISKSNNPSSKWKEVKEGTVMHSIISATVDYLSARQH